MNTGLDMELEIFSGRRESLEKIERYVGTNGDKEFPLMFYRTNDYIHSNRVLWLLEDIIDILKEIYPSLDIGKAKIQAIVHDDHEIIGGDETLSSKKKMNEEEKLQSKIKERKSIYTLTKRYPLIIGGYSYTGVLLEFFYKNTLSARVNSLMDKVDAFNECLHEIFAGNSVFIGAAKNNINIIFNEYPEKFKELQPLIQSGHDLFNIPEDLDLDKICADGKPHTLESIETIDTGIKMYERWKEITISKGFGSHLYIMEERK